MELNDRIIKINGGIVFENHFSEDPLKDYNNQFKGLLALCEFYEEYIRKHREYVKKLVREKLNGNIKKFNRETKLVKIGR